MSFRKFPSIENHYQEAFIEKAILHNPELLDLTFIKSEKLHGANVQIAYDIKEGKPFDLKLGRRGDYLVEDEKFYGFSSFMEAEEFGPLGVYLYRLGYKHQKSVRVFGEFFGENIQKGVVYHPGKQLRVYDIMIADDLMPQKKMIMEFEMHGMIDLLAPIIGEPCTLAEALAFDVETFITTLGPQDEDNFAEGVVIKPYERPVTLGNGKNFYIKKKNTKFKDKSREPKVRKEMRADLKEMRDEFRTYLNDVRVQDLFSKMGPIEDKKQIGTYIQALMADAVEDFVKDYPEATDLEKAERKQVYNAGPMPAQLLMKYV